MLLLLTVSKALGPEGAPEMLPNRWGCGAGRARVPGLRPRSRVLSTFFCLFFSAPADLLRPLVGVRVRMRLLAARAHHPGRPLFTWGDRPGQLGRVTPHRARCPPPLGVRMLQTPGRGRSLRLRGWGISCLPTKTCASGGSLLIKENWNSSLKVKLSGSSLDLNWRARKVKSLQTCPTL